ncbi:MAG: FtsX-like permease family protein [Bacteroidales bacterium]
MISLKLAIKNLLGAGLRTWLNVFVLSLAFVIIVFYNGMLDGWNRQAYNDTQNWETGSGQLWDPRYDPYDPYSLQDAHSTVSPAAERLVNEQVLTPVLVTQATIYPGGRMQNILLKGIDPRQTILKLPTELLDTAGPSLPAIIGNRMAESCKLKQGDLVLIRWRDKNGTFDAREVMIAGIFNANVPSIDNGQVWISLDKLREMTGLPGSATYLVTGPSYAGGNLETWQYHDLKYLLKEIDEVIQAKKGSARVIYLLLLCIALLAIFDTQVLSIFRRQKEIGTYIALGMTRLQVVKIFTVEGSMHSLLALILGALYGIPFLSFLQRVGIPMPKTADSMGMSIADKIIPFYSLGMVISTILLVVISATIVSYFPARRISKMNPTDALKGKIQ